MLEEDIVEPDRLEWVAPVDLASKPDGTPRFFVGNRKLNAVMIENRYPLPRMEDCLNSLGDASYFSNLACNWGSGKSPSGKGSP